MTAIEPQPDPANEPGGEFRQKYEDTLGQNAELAKENSFLRAQIDPDSPQGQAISQVIGTGEFTPETVRAAAESLRSAFGGGNEPPPDPTPDPVPDPDAERRAAAQQQQAITVGAGDKVDPPPPPDRVEQGWAGFQEARAAGTPVDEASSHVLGALVQDVVERGADSPYYMDDTRQRLRREGQLQ